MAADCYARSLSRAHARIIEIDASRHEDFMAICAITGKRWMNGSKISHSNIKSPKRFAANIQAKRVWDVDAKKWVRIKVSARGLKVLNKKSLREALLG